MIYGCSTLSELCRGTVQAECRSLSACKLGGLLALLVALLVSPAYALEVEGGSSCGTQGGLPVLQIDTELGSIVIELFEDAAPASRSRFYEQLVDLSGVGGFFDNAAFDYTSPHREIRLTGASEASPPMIDL